MEADFGVRIIVIIVSSIIDVKSEVQLCFLASLVDEHSREGLSIGEELRGCECLILLGVVQEDGGVKEEDEETRVDHQCGECSSKCPMRVSIVILDRNRVSKLVDLLKGAQELIPCVLTWLLTVLAISHRNASI